MRSLYFNAFRACCSTIRAPMPCSSAAVRTALNKRSTIIGASPNDNSSASSNCGSRLNARPSAIICCSPPESMPPRISSRGSSDGNNSSTRSTLPPPILMLSRADILVKMRRSSVTKPMPFRTRWYIGVNVGTFDSMTMPSTGGNCPAIVSKVVDLPAPLGPNSATTSPRFTVMFAPVTTSRPR